MHTSNHTSASGNTRAEARSCDQLRPSRRVSSSQLQPQQLPLPLVAADHNSPASNITNITPRLPDTSALSTSQVSPLPFSPPNVSSHHRPNSLSATLKKREDRQVDSSSSKSRRTRNTTTLSDRIQRREHLHNREVVAKRLRGATKFGSNSATSLVELASSTTTTSTATADSTASAADIIRPSHRRRASEESSYFEGHPQKRQHPDQYLHAAMPLSPKKTRGIAMSDFEFAKVLGSGGTATVIRAEPIPGSNASLAIPAKEVALKAVTRKGLNRRGQHYLHREIAIHRNVQQHANIASLYEVFEDSEGIYLAMEYLRGADLYTVLKKERRGLSERIALCIISQILDALSYMHALGYAHRDIKPENLMFQDKPNFHEGKVGMIKLIDFGLACARDPNARCEERTSSEKCGTVRYAAPEIVTEASYVPELCDIWSVGIVMYSIIAHRNPYTGKTEKEVLQQILNTNLTFDTPEWDRVSEDSKRLIRAMLSRKACDRPHAAEALKEVRRILQQLSPSTSSSSCVSTDSTGHGHGRRRPGDDVSGFSSHVTPERQGSRNPSRGGEANGGGNFLDGLIKAFFSRGSSAERSGSEGS